MKEENVIKLPLIDDPCLVQEEMEKHLTKEASHYSISIVEDIDSTNEALKKRAREKGAKESAKKGLVPPVEVLAALHQSAGKGRRGRSFYSPKGTGLYLSFLLRPQLKAEQTLRITTMAAVAVAMAIEKVSGKEVKIKWVNDLFVDGKKIVGILTEAGFSGEKACRSAAATEGAAESAGGPNPEGAAQKAAALTLDYAVLGIGINLWEPEEGFPEEIRQIAGAINIPVPEELSREEKTAYRNRLRGQLLAEVINEIARLYPQVFQEDHREYMEEYRKRSLVLHQKVTLFTPDHQALNEEVLVEDIGEEAELVVRDASGKLRRVLSGEVSVRL